MKNTSPAVDLGRAVLPTPAVVDQAFSRTLRTLSASDQLGTLFRLPHGLGTERSRLAGARWIGRRLAVAPDPDRVLLTHGTQNALAIVFTAKVRGIGALATERLTYSSIRPLAGHLQIPVVGLDIDSFGLVPEALEAACRQQRVAALYINPTIHSPTATVMPPERRHAIAQIARRHGVWIVEDDVQAFLDDTLPAPIASIAPDITWYVAAFGKSLNLGLRNAYLLAPAASELVATLGSIHTLTSWGATALSAQIGTLWIEDDTVSEIITHMAIEAAARQGLAAEILAGATFNAHRAAHHLWLTLPPSWSAAQFARRAEEEGVLVWPAEKFLAAPGPSEAAVRLSISAPPTLSELRVGLTRVRELLQTTPA